VLELADSDRRGLGYIGGTGEDAFHYFTYSHTHIMNLRNPFPPARSLSTSTTMQGAPASLSTVGFRGCDRSIYGDLDPPACTRNSATVICGKVRKDEYSTSILLTGPSENQWPRSLPKSYTWSSKSQASNVSSPPRAFSDSQFGTPK
jgi:hypothetical protein